MGIEPTPPAWKAGALPLSYARTLFRQPTPAKSAARLTWHHRLYCLTLLLVQIPFGRRWFAVTLLPVERSSGPIDVTRASTHPNAVTVGSLATSIGEPGLALAAPPAPTIPLPERCLSMRLQNHEMVGAGFEPAKAEPPDLQSGPFDRSGIPPWWLKKNRRNSKLAEGFEPTTPCLQNRSSAVELR
jgi:hypothetical protein